MRQAFTLVELMIVLLILGILAAIVIPRYASGATEAEAAAIMTTLQSTQAKVAEYQARNSEWPDTIDADWFVGGTVKHPQNKSEIAAVEVVDDDSLTEPTNKVLKAGVGGAYWYNTANGAFRARVTEQGSEATTLDFYNRINGAAATTLGNHSGGGGS